MKLLEKWHAMPEMAKSSIAFVFTSFFVSGLGFLTTPVFTRLLSSSEYGEISTYNSWLSIIEIFAALGFTSAGVINVGLNEYKDNRKDFITSIIFFCNIVTVIVFGLIYAICHSLGLKLFVSDSLMLLMFIHFMFYPTYAIWLAYQRYEYKYKTAVIISVLSSVLGQFFSIWAVIHFKENLASVKLWANEIGMLLMCVPLYFVLAVKNIGRVNTSIWKNMLIFSLPLVPHYLAQHIMLSSDRIMISEFANLSSTGIYNVSSNICYIALIIWNAVNASLTPYTYSKITDKEKDGLQSIVNGLLTVYAVICFLVSLLSPEILWILAPEEYSKGVYVIPPMISSSFMTALYNVYANIEFFYKKNIAITVATVIASAVNIILNLIFIPKFGYIAAAYTTLVSYIVLVGIHYINYKKCPVDSVYNDKYIFILMLIVVSSCSLCSLLYSNNLLRYGIIITASALVFLKRKYILGLIKMLRNKK